MKLEGKVINFLGDSITEGIAATDLQGFPLLMKERYGLERVRVYGLHDTRIARQQTPSPYPQWDLDFYLRALDMHPETDVVVVFGGTNDFGTGDAPLGTPDDRSRDTFYGAVHALFSLLKAWYPQVVVLTPLPRITEEDPASGKTLVSYVEAIRRVAAYYELPLLDLYTQSGFDPTDASVMPDGLHPSDKGHAMLAEIIGTFLQTL